MRSDPLSTGLLPCTEQCQKSANGQKHDSAKEKRESGFSPPPGGGAGRSRRRGTRPVEGRGLAGIVSKEETQDDHCKSKDQQGLTDPFANHHRPPQVGHGVVPQQVLCLGEIDVLYHPPSPGLSEETTVPATARRWVEESRAWVAEKQRQGKYQGRNGYEAVRFLSKCGEWVSVPPGRIAEQDLWAIIGHVGGSAPKTRRFYLALLGSFLSARGNWVVQTSAIRRRFPNRSMNTPVLSGEERDAILNAAQGPERLVLALLTNARRPVEVRRALVSDVDLAVVPPTMRVRTKGGGGQVTAVRPLNQTALRELTWWLPLRATWAERASEDSGHLVCRWDGERLVGVSAAFLSRLLASAEGRAGVPRHSLYSFRRGAATMLRERGAQWEDIRDALCHRSISTTEQYVSPLLAQKHAPAVMALLDTPTVGSG